VTDPEKQGDDQARWARYASVISLVPASVFTGYLIGYGLDYLFSTQFLRFVFLILGVAGGFVQLTRELDRGRRAGK
jgi:F0F1-type ATP synthase assembly protein I